MVRRPTLEETADRIVTQAMDAIFGTGKGVPLTQVYDKNMPIPTYILKWGENMPKEIFAALQEGEAALLLDREGNPYSVVIIDTTGTVREKSIQRVREENKAKRRKALE